MMVPAPKSGMNAAQFCKYLQRVIDKLGPDAFAHNGRVILYSGPSETVKAILGPSTIPNWKRSEEQATREGAVRIDDTNIGKLLNAIGLKNYFRGAYGLDQILRKQAADIVWGYASRAFMKAGFRHVT